MNYLIVLVLLVFVSCSSKNDPLALPGNLEEAIVTGYRSPENIKRDHYRHPVQTLSFLGIESDMTVIEVSPGKGWYMEILAPLLAKKGKYIMAVPLADKPYFKANDELIHAWKVKYPQVGNNMETFIFSPPHNMKLPPNNTADMVLTFRNVHNWISVKGEKQAFKAFYNVLKPGGILGVVEHRGLPSQNDPLAKSGYVGEQDVIEMAINAGFRLIATSEINANNKDTKNYPQGVWTLPPSLRLGEIDQAKYIEIGESDRMTLKFMKP